MKPDFVVTFDGPNGDCLVAHVVTASAKHIPCDQVVSYVANDLKLPAGALFEIATIPDVRERDFDHVMAALSAAGYKLTPGPHIGFLTAPKP